MSPSIKKAAPVKGKPSQAKKGKKLTAGQKILQEMAKFFSRGKQSPGKVRRFNVVLARSRCALSRFGRANCAAARRPFTLADC